VSELDRLGAFLLLDEGRDPLARAGRDWKIADIQEI